MKYMESSDLLFLKVIYLSSAMNCLIEVEEWTVSVDYPVPKQSVTLYIQLIVVDQDHCDYIIDTSDAFNVVAQLHMH